MHNMFRRFPFLAAMGMLFLSLGCDTPISTQAPNTPIEVPDPASFITYVPGNMPLLITVSHGGSLRPAGFRSRTCPGAVSVTDSYTLELATEIMKAFATHGLKPYLVTNSLHRSILDPNRNREDGTCNDARSAVAWDTFHQSIELASAQITQRHARGLLIDLHGHGHPVQRLELGYLLTADELFLTDSLINTNDLQRRSSVFGLHTTHAPDSSFSGLIRGELSLGSLLNIAGYPSVPSNIDPHPEFGEPYFSGGYITTTYGSIRNGPIDAIQIECNMTGVRDTPENRFHFAEALSTQLREFLHEWYAFHPI